MALVVLLSRSPDSPWLDLVLVLVLRLTSRDAPLAFVEYVSSRSPDSRTSLMSNGVWRDVTVSAFWVPNSWLGDVLLSHCRCLLVFKLGQTI